MTFSLNFTTIECSPSHGKEASTVRYHSGTYHSVPLASNLFKSDKTFSSPRNRYKLKKVQSYISPLLLHSQERQHNLATWFCCTAHPPFLTSSENRKHIQTIQCMRIRYNSARIIQNGGILDIGYRLERNFCRSLFLRIGDFLCFRELIFAIGTDWFFLPGFNFCDFHKVPCTKH